MSHSARIDGAARSGERLAHWGLLKTIGVGVLLAILAFGAVETLLRGWVYLIRDPSERFDTATGTFVLVPGSHPRPRARPFLVNSRGFVGDEFQDPAPSGTIRMVTVGDSCTFGAGTTGESYPGLLERHLNDAGHGRRYQVINAGIRGLNTELALRRLITKVMPLGPDVVTVYLGWNDLMKFEPMGQVEKPGIRILARMLDRLWVVKGMRKLLFYYLRPLVLTPATGPRSRTGAFRDYEPAVFEQNLRRIIATVRDAGGRVVLFTLPSVVSDDMTIEDLRRAQVVFPYYASAYGVGDLVDVIAAYNRAIRRMAKQEHVRLVDLALEIDGRPDRRSLFHDTMHPSQKGRELIARILVQRLSDL
jgi:lysophospholipase L1-like esterase